MKQVRETPYKREQRFVEFFDVRDAAKALRVMNGKVISGKPIVVQFSRPGGLTKKLFLASRFHKDFIFHSNDNNHYHPTPPPPPPMVKSNNQMYEQQKKNNNNKKKKKPNKHIKRNLGAPRFMINENAIDDAGEFSDGRTTVMIKNIPNKYT